MSEQTQLSIKLKTNLEMLRIQVCPSKPNYTLQYTILYTHTQMYVLCCNFDLSIFSPQTPLSVAAGQYEWTQEILQITQPSM